MLAWLNAIEAYKETGNELPINLRVRANNPFIEIWKFFLGPAQKSPFLINRLQGNHTGQTKHYYS